MSACLHPVRTSRPALIDVISTLDRLLAIEAVAETNAASAYAPVAPRAATEDESTDGAYSLDLLK